MSTANFRASIGGFHRGDVVNFIEENSIAHEKAVRKLKEEISKLQQQLAAALAQRDDMAAQLAEAQAALQVQQQVPQDDAAPAEAEASPAAGLDELELAAYRRAEAAERSAQLRVSRLCRQANRLVEDASKEFAASSADFSDLGAQLQENLQRLEGAFMEIQLLMSRTTQAFSQMSPPPVSDAAEAQQ